MKAFLLAAACAAACTFATGALAAELTPSIALDVGTGSSIVGGGSAELDTSLGGGITLGGGLEAQGFANAEFSALEAATITLGDTFTLDGRAITLAAFGGAGEAQGAGSRAAYVAGAALDYFPSGSSVGGGLRYEHVATDAARFSPGSASADVVMARLIYRP